MRCQKCDKEITGLIFHCEDGDYCYECRKKIAKPIVRVVQKRRKSPVKTLIRKGYKPTEIAEMLNMTLEEVIEERYR